MTEQLPWTCEHESTRPCRRKNTNGVVVVVQQCLRCGRAVSNLKKSSFALATLPWLDEQIRVDFDVEAEKQRKAYYESKQTEYLRQQTEAATAFWSAYNAYLKSDRWLTKRTQAIGRANGFCMAGLSGCTKFAEEVHHITYQHCPAKDPDFEEPLFDLRPVCRHCHKKITWMDRHR